MTDTERFPWGPVIVGALVCLLVQVACVLVGSGIGLTAFEVERGEGFGKAPALGTAVYLGLSLLLSYFVGAYLAARWSGSIGSRTAPGIAVWSIASALLIFTVGRGMASSMSDVLVNAGIGAGAAGGADAVLRKLDKVRLVSNVKLTDGEIVTQVEIPQTKGGAAAAAAREVKQDVEALDSEKNRREVREAAEDVREVTAAASFAAVGALLLSFLAALAGSTVGARRTARRARQIHSDDSRRAA